MAIAKRILLFVLVNILVVATISIVLHVLGVRPYLHQYGIDYNSLMAYCLIWGMGGAFISLGLSRLMAKWMMGVKLVDPSSTRDPELQRLVETVYQLSRSAGLPVMPQVGVYDSPEVNAFATGPTKSRALVAVSAGLLSRMNRAEAEGVLGHEVAHIANGDMVTMTLVQGIVNAFVMFLSRAIAFFLAQALRSDREEREGGFSHGTYFIISFVLEMILMVLGMMVVAWFSRFREFRADRGGARLAGRDNMIRALEALRRTHGLVDPSAQLSVQALKISSRPGGFLALFSTHPPLEERIARLETMA